MCIEIERVKNVKFLIKNFVSRRFNNAFCLHKFMFFSIINKTSQESGK